MSSVALICAQVKAWHLLDAKSSWERTKMSAQECWSKGSCVAGWAPPRIDVIWLGVPRPATIARAELAVPTPGPIAARA
jgi:hypothetical protein